MLCVCEGVGIRVGVRHARGSRKWIPRSDPMDLDLGFYGIIDPQLFILSKDPLGS